MTQILSPTFMRCSPADAHGSISIHASGAPSDPCFGASLRLFRVERITPIGRRLKRPPCFGFILPSYDEKARNWYVDTSSARASRPAPNAARGINNQLQL